MGIGCFLIAGIELFFRLSLHNLDQKEVSIFVWSQSIALGFCLILLGRIGLIEAKIKKLEQVLLKPSSSEGDCIDNEK